MVTNWFDLPFLKQKVEVSNPGPQLLIFLQFFICNLPLTFHTLKQFINVFVVSKTHWARMGHIARVLVRGGLSPAVEGTAAG